MSDLESRIKEIFDTFKPSTTFEQGNLIDTDYEKWSKEVQPLQNGDWQKIKKLLRGTWGKLNWKYRGWIFNQCRAKYNWNGWATTDGIALSLALKEVKR